MGLANVPGRAIEGAMYIYGDSWKGILPVAGDRALTFMYDADRRKRDAKRRSRATLHLIPDS
jgi:hypothetical protein